MKPPAAEPHLLQHTGPALVFDNYAQMKKAVADPDLDVTADHIHGAAPCRPDRRARNAGMGHAADPEEAA